MPPDAENPGLPDPKASPEAEASSLADNVRNTMLGIGSIGLELANLGAEPPPGGDRGHEPIGESPAARTWYGSILQWTWAILIFLVGVAALLFMILLGIGWVMSWFG